MAIERNHIPEMMVASSSLPCKEPVSLQSSTSMRTSSSSSDIATTYDDFQRRRSGSESNAFSSSLWSGSHGGDGATSDFEEDDSAAPTAALRFPLALPWIMSETEADEDLLPPAVKELPMHRTRTTLDLCEEARGFSSHSNPQVIQTICIQRVPGWSGLTSTEDINVNQIMAGLSNQLFKVSVREDFLQRASFAYPHVLFRVYGKDVSTLYDPHTELQVFKTLSRRSVAPKLIAEFEGGRIEEWIEGSALLVTDMKKSAVIAGISAILAGIHQVDLSHIIDKTTPCVQKFLERWRSNAMEIYQGVGLDHPSYLALQRLELPKLYEESFKLKQLLLPEGVQETCATRLVFCHNDVQENNILVCQTRLRLIDFEYSGYNYPAFDMASYFWEMTCDYCVDSYPFFQIDPMRYPRIGKRRLFVAMYLSRLLRRTVTTTGDLALIDSVVEAVERFQLATHMLWAFWAVIRAPQAATATSFDMLYYCQKRIDAYWSHKAKLIVQGLLPDNKGRWNAKCMVEDDGLEAK